MVKIIDTKEFIKDAKKALYEETLNSLAKPIATGVGHETTRSSTRGRHRVVADGGGESADLSSENPMRVCAQNHTWRGAEGSACPKCAGNATV